MPEFAGSVADEPVIGGVVVRHERHADHDEYDVSHRQIQQQQVYSRPRRLSYRTYDSEVECQIACCQSFLMHGATSKCWETRSLALMCGQRQVYGRPHLVSGQRHDDDEEVAEKTDKYDDCEHRRCGDLVQDEMKQDVVL